jgi:hypothetical protein
VPAILVERVIRGALFTSPHRGEVDLLPAMRSIVRCKSGEGSRTNEKPYPLTPTRSPWEKEQTFYRRSSFINRTELQTFRFIQTAFGSVKFSIADVPCSRPKPESRTPPHGNRTSV